MNLHYIHIGKTGGTALKRALLDNGLAARADWEEERIAKVPTTPYGRIILHTHTFNLRKLPEGEHVFFTLRDPISRFVSGFQSRYRKGLPRYFVEWTDKERAAFESFPTPEALAHGLSSGDRAERELAEWAMNNVQHLESIHQFLGKRALLRSKLQHVVYIARQETLATDWEQLKILLELPRDIELPSDPLVAHRRDASQDVPLDEQAVENLREWYARDYKLIALCERLRRANDWGVAGVRPRTDTIAARPAAATGAPAGEPSPKVDGEAIRELATGAGSRLDLWTEFLNRTRARTLAEIGVWRGDYAERVLADCESVDRYYMIDPWQHLDDWNKPANRDDDTFQEIFEEAMARTRAHETKREVLRGRTKDVIDRIPDESLDFAYVDGDHTLRGVTVDLLRVFPKVRGGGWIGGDDFSRSVWQHGGAFEPTLVFPFAVHFAEAVDSRIYALPHKQFLIEKGTGFEFVDLVGKYGDTDLRRQLKGRAGQNGKSGKAAKRVKRPRTFVQGARTRTGRRAHRALRSIARPRSLYRKTRRRAGRLKRRILARMR